ncbi:expressed unknown protein [Seminavis robusta]|uniref:Uncharacterized protein n=1 Tax=Seminavis robusta TaxID=568900 RepID=A0A9N8F207_9STRA|nr:expressed unknown protein [Seminavis robusta]|eukprot:Sro2414_g326810.1 n/a (152) ;mRNA; f:3581-4036
MTDVYDGLNEEDKGRVLVLAVGKLEYEALDSEFCKGSFGMCHDAEEDPWWNSWSAEQRDVFFFYRSNGTEWTYFCQYSMNDYLDQFESTVEDLIRMASGATTSTGATVDGESGEDTGSGEDTESEEPSGSLAIDVSWKAFILFLFGMALTR